VIAQKVIAREVSGLGDPLFDHGLSLAVWIILVVKAVAIFALVMGSVVFMVMYERKAVAYLGVRYGPNRAGPNGWLQSVADGTKLLFKEAFTPRGADKVVYKIAPYLMMVPAVLAFSIVPLGGTITVAHHTTDLQLANPPWGILFLLMCSGISVYGVMLAGWASGSKYPLLGSVRASAQLVSYEAVLGLTTATVVVVSSSLRTTAIVAAQHGPFLYHWNFLRTAIIPFAVFSIAITAEMTRPPFDLVEAEEELSGGYNLEYASTDFMWFYLAEYAALVTNSAIIVTLWFGGPDGPRIASHSIGPIWFVIKLLIILYIYVWIRATLPRLRYDQLMDLGWKRLIPLGLAMLLIVAGFQVNRKWGLIAFGAAVVLGLLLWRAIDVGHEASALEAERDERVTRNGPMGRPSQEAPR
jgi:NADH-quinone oxidoreductase subunit H